MEITLCERKKVCVCLAVLQLSLALVSTNGKQLLYDSPSSGLSEYTELI